MFFLIENCLLSVSNDIWEKNLLQICRYFFYLFRHAVFVKHEEEIKDK